MTVANHLELPAHMNVLIAQHALREAPLVPAARQARKYRNLLICSRIATATHVHGLTNELLPLHLRRLGPSPHYVAW